MRADKRHDIGMTLLFTVVVLCFAVTTILLVGLSVWMLVKLGILPGEGTYGTPDKALVVFCFLTLAFGAVMTVIFARIPMRPIISMIKQMQRLSAGDYKVRIDSSEMLGKHPAIFELANSFNRMAEELENTELLRKDFINNFSHEFKTPIVSIAGFAKLLQRSELPDEVRAEYLKVIEEESLRLSEMATNVLNMTKVDNQAYLTDTVRYNLSEQIRNCILLLLSKWEKKEIEFELEFDEIEVIANEELLKQAFINLIDNAIKFSEPGGTVAVEIHETAYTTSVTVKNHGPEIPEERREWIFNKFYQADESHATEGNGVGLAVVKKVMDLHNGSVSVSCKDGVTAFTVRLPRRRV